MSDILSDGSIVQDGLKYQKRGDYPGVDLGNLTYPVSGYVIAVYSLDNEFNALGDAVVCDVHIPVLSIDLFRVPVSLQRGSPDNYISTNPTAFKANLDKSEFRQGQISAEQGDGETVIVQFLNASLKSPIITGVIPHHASGFNGLSPSPREGEAAGDHYKVRFNGTNLFIDKDGNFTVETTKALDEKIPLGKKFSVKFVTPDKSQKVVLELDNSENTPKASLMVTDKDGKNQAAVFDGTAKTIGITNDLSDGQNSIAMSDAGIDLSAKAKIKSSAKDVEISAEESAKVSAKDFEVNAQGSAKVKASTEAEFAGDGGTKVGSSGSTTKVQGSQVMLGMGGVGVAKIGSQVLSTGNLGMPAIGYIVQGSTTVTTS